MSLFPALDAGSMRAAAAAHSPPPRRHVNGTSDATEIKLYSNARERDHVENMAELFAVVTLTERLEKAYTRSAIPPREYEVQCRKLITQFKMLKDVLRQVVPDVPAFLAAHHMYCPAAVRRLIEVGAPATVEHGGVGTDTGKERVVVAQCVQAFITAMDSLKLSYVAVDELHPLLSELMSSLNALTTLPPEFEGRNKLTAWMTKLNAMQASDQLTESEGRQLMFDLETSYNEFVVFLDK